MRVRGIQHVNLNVRDLERVCRSYEQVLGFRRSFAKGEIYLAPEFRLPA